MDSDPWNRNSVGGASIERSGEGVGSSVRVGFDVTVLVEAIWGFVDVFVGSFEFTPEIVVDSLGLPVGVVFWCVGVVVVDRVDSPGEDVTVGSTLKEKDRSNKFDNEHPAKAIIEKINMINRSFSFIRSKVFRMF